MNKISYIYVNINLKYLIIFKEEQITIEFLLQ